MRLLALVLLLTTSATAELQCPDCDYEPAISVDIASPQWWLVHPVLGGPSTVSEDEARETKTIFHGKPPYEWPVNGTLFADPVSGKLYAYVGVYCRGYKLDPSLPAHCVVLRSEDNGKTWEDLGQIFPTAKEHVYTGDTSPIGHAPDASVIYADGRYHACFDWTTANTTWENAHAPGPEANSGVGYAWADAPEGPWHITERPIATTRETTALAGKYRRLYASSLFRREHDWLVLTAVDSGPHFGWGMVGMTAANPEGPYSEPKLLLSCERDEYYPPLTEFFPAYMEIGINEKQMIHLPGTSVAKSRAVQSRFVVESEQAMDPAAWRLKAMAAMALPPARPEIAEGIWGQSYSRSTGGPSGYLLFPSRDAHDFGTINLAGDRQMRHGDGGLSFHASNTPMLAVCPFTNEAREVRASFTLKGAMVLYFAFDAPLGADTPRSDCVINPASLQRFGSVRIDDKGNWEHPGNPRYPGPIKGTVPISSAPNETTARNIEIRVSPSYQRKLYLDGQLIHEGRGYYPNGGIAVLVEKGSSVHFDDLIVQAPLAEDSAQTAWLPSEALLGAAQNLADWEDLPCEECPAGSQFVSISPNVRAKWNFVGNGATLFAPRGPLLGTAEALLDGKTVAEIDLHSATEEKASEILQLKDLELGRHALILRPKSGKIAIGMFHAAIPSLARMASDMKMQQDVWNCYGNL